MADEAVPLSSSRTMAPTTTESVLSLRIVTLDYYMAPPIPELDACYSVLLGQPIAEVPVVRIFGSTLTGQKMCLHLHKAFPYLYVPYEEGLPQDITSALALVRNLASAIEKALKLASHVGAKRQHVYSCSLVRGKKFYGFHNTEQLFVKIVLYYPQEVQRLSGLLLGGGILNIRFQPYEAHIPFLLQVMVDYNLAGMGHIHLSDVKFRPPMLKNEFIQISSSKTNLKHVVTFLANHMTHSNSLNTEKQIPFSNLNFVQLWCTQQDGGMVGLGNMLPVEKQSTCELEGDTTVEGILNQYELTYVPLEKAGPEVKMVQSLLPIWDELDATGSMNAAGMKRQGAPSNQNAKAAAYVEEYQRTFERILDLQEGSPLSISDVLGIDEKNHTEGSCTVREDLTMKRNTLLQCTQAAYSKRSIVKKNSNSNEDELSALSGVSVEKVDKESTLLNEDMIRHQLNRTSQDTDEEAVELLRWMDGYCSEHEKEDDEISWSQAFQCADEALAKFMSDYELSSQLECQAIIDCSGEDPEAPLVEGTTTGGSTFAWVEERRYIPQVDGADDEEDALDPVLSVKLKGKLKSICMEDKGGLNTGQLSMNDVNTPKHGDEYRRQGWGPHLGKSLHHCSLDNGPDLSREDDCDSEMSLDNELGIPSVSLDNELGIPSVKTYGAKKDLLCLDSPSYRDVSDSTSSAAKQSVRDLMRSKRQKRQQMDVVVSRASLEAAYADRSLVKDERVKAEYSRFEEASVTPSSRSSSEKGKISDKQPEERLAQSLRFGPLPLVKKCAYASISKPCFTPEEDTKGVKPCMAQEEVRTGVPSSQPVMHPLSDDVSNAHVCDDVSGPVLGAELLSSGGTVDCHTCTHPEQENNGNCSLVVDREESNTDFDCGPLILVINEKPPTAEHLLATLENYSAPSAKHRDVFYGNAEDLPDQPAVMAGMVFKVSSKEMDDLPPYQFLKDAHNADTDRKYVCSNTWAPSMEDCAAVLPSHFQNDGTVSYLLSPVKPPPTQHDVFRWLRQWRKGHHVEHETTCKQTTCKENSQNGQTDVDDDDSQPTQLLVPSSPKYDEMFMLSSFSNDAKNCQKNTYDSGVGGECASDSPSKLVKGQASRIYGKAVTELPRGRRNVSQISPPTANNQFTPLSQAGFRDPASIGGGQQTSVLSIEVFASTRGDLRPDPRYDAIKCIVMVMHYDMGDQELTASHTTVLLFDEKEELFRNHDALIGCEVVTLKDEACLLQMFVWFVRMFDPDMLVGWEIQGLSLGLLAERAANLGIGLVREISRLPATKVFPHSMEWAGETETGPKEFGNVRVQGVVEASIIDDEWGRTHGSGIHVGGRIVLNLWRIMRGEIKLGIYSVEAVAEAVLKRKVPLISLRTLTEWFSSGSGRKRHLCVDYVVNRARLNLQIMDQLDLVNRTSELARVFGIDFFSVLSRGSQYRVESMMLRVAHSQNFLLISPSRQQVASQPAMQCLPLVMEPESRFYTDPVVVLDFQSLYPSMMIAYNLCFSTCLGQLVPDNPKVLGVTSLNADTGMLRGIKDSLTFTPNGIMFVSSLACPGVLPRLLDEILSTRIMVKQAMKKLLPTQRVLQRVLNARQLALKLISNVTYGYTAAGFSGRMPCAELADSIVQAGRYTLESAINIVNTNEEWNARVVYGDTDSMFVLLKGRSREEAFRIGEQIASVITKQNPHPVTLKMEKVYHPCALLTKKRYVGYSFESREQMMPKFDAKGIETVRRDSCGAVAKILEKSLRILFETHNLSQVKAYLRRQWGKIISGRVSLKDFIFAKEVRLGTYSTRTSVLPPAAIVATKAMSIDPRAEPRYGERVPYLVIHGEPGARLVDMVVDPYILVSMRSPFRLHDTYYITKQIIPALQRVFGLVGVDLSAWYHDMPRLLRPPAAKRVPSAFPFPKCPPMHVSGQVGVDANQSTRHTIDHYYLSQHCVVCGGLVQASCPICKQCSENEVLANVSLLGRSCRLEREFKHLLEICRHCGGGEEKDMEEGLGCVSLACSVFYERIKVQKECRAALAISNLNG